jgi:hypothetical protein
MPTRRGRSKTPAKTARRLCKACQKTKSLPAGKGRRAGGLNVVDLEKEYEGETRGELVKNLRSSGDCRKACNKAGLKQTGRRRSRSRR